MLLKSSWFQGFSYFGPDLTIPTAAGCTDNKVCTGKQVKFLGGSEPSFSSLWNHKRFYFLVFFPFTFPLDFFLSKIDLINPKNAKSEKDLHSRTPNYWSARWDKLWSVRLILIKDVTKLSSNLHLMSHPIICHHVVSCFFLITLRWEDCSVASPPLT